MNKELIIFGSISLFVILIFVGNYNIQKMHSGGFYRSDPEIENLGPVLYYEEGLYATVSVRQTYGVGRALFVSGTGQGSNSIADLRVNFLLADLPLLINPEAKNALVIGLGTGMTSGQLTQYTNVKTVEIEKKVLETTQYFEAFNLNVLENLNHTIIIDDGRNYLLKNNEKQDIIITAPANIWQSFSTALFSKEYLELVKEDLSDNGLYVQWVPIYTMSPEDFKNFYTTFNSIFPNNVGFANMKPSENLPVTIGTSEIILIGSKQEIDISEETFNKNYNSFTEQSKGYLRLIKLPSGNNIFNLFLFTDKDLEGYANGYDLVTDDNLLLEFSTAKNVYSSNPDKVIEDINKFLGKRQSV